MKKSYKIVFIIITIVIMIFLSTLEIYAYGDHQSLVTASFDILADEKEEVYQFYSNNYIDNKNYLTKIVGNSETPDWSSIEGGESINGTHYYVYEGTPSTNGHYYKNNVFPINGFGISARTRFEDHYGNAINCYKNGDYNNAIQSLGRAIHYLQDIGCTPHSAGMTYGSSNSSHAKFENYIKVNIDLLISEAKLNHVANYGTADFGKYDLYLSSYEDICNSVAAYSSSFAGDLEFEESIEYENAAIENVSQTLSYIAGLLYKFYYDVEIKNSCHEIKSGSTYFIKHVETGKFLHLGDINTLDIALEDFDGSANQQFELTHNHILGAFEISSIAHPNQKITIETSNYTLQHSSTNPEPFKIIYDGYEHYRISPKTNANSINKQSYNYTKYLKKDSSSDSISCPSSDPTDLSILWDFIEVIYHENSSITYVSKSNKKVLSYSPTALNNHPLYIVSSHDINVDVFDCTLGSSSNYTQNTIDQYTFINGHQYLISISFQNSYYEGYVICYNNSNMVDYYQGLEVNLPIGRSQLIYFAPFSTNEYIIETNLNVDMKIYEQSTAEVCIIYNSDESQDIYSKTLHQFDTNCFYYILLFNSSEVIGEDVNFSITCLSDEFIVPSYKNIELVSDETKIYKIDLSENKIMTLYTTDRNVLLQLYVLMNHNLVLLCDNVDDISVPLTEEIEENKSYYLYIASSTSQTNELFISYNASFTSTVLTVTENDENDNPKVYHEVISTYGEFKFYHFTPITSGLYYFRTKAQQNGNTYMELYDSEGTLLSVDDNSGDIWSAKIDYYLVAGEDYYFSVRYKYYYSSGQYDLQIYNEDICIWKINWSQVLKSYANMADFTIITNIYIWSLGVIDNVDFNTRKITFSSMTWSYSIVTQEPYLYQTIGMIIGSSYLGEYIDPITGYTSYSYLLIEGGGELDTQAVIPNTWYYECTYYDISIEFSIEELEYYLDQGIIRFEPIESG